MMNKQSPYLSRIERVLEQCLPADHTSPKELNQAIRYSVLGGGKRIRPLLVYATGEALEINPDILDLPAAAVELIHAYSLVHDDLPCMDDDDLRRGKATTHKAFNDALAVLSGDALQTLAFDILSQPMTHVSATNQLQIINTLASASGVNGMVKGQALDLDAEGKDLTQQELETMHQLKTGALIRASVLMATYCLPESDPLIKKRARLLTYANAIGLAFQVRDDILDIQGETEVIGKQQGADIAAGKVTYPSLMGMGSAKKKLFQLYEEAVDALSVFGSEADLLRSIAEFIVKRIA